MRKSTIWGVAAGCATMLVATGSYAQDQGTGTAGTGTGTASVGASAATTPANVTTPTVPKQVVTTPAPAAADEGQTDHARVVGKFGVGYFGVSQLPIAAVGGGGGGLNVTRANVNAPTVGVRYWLNEMIGLDIGVGLGITSGSTETVNGATTVTTDKPSAFGLGFHAGLPLALGTAGKHFTFEVTPEVNFGFTSGTIKQTAAPGAPAPPDIDLSGLRLDIGARAGAEIHFGFMGLPELALQGSVGIFFRRESIKAKTNIAGSDVSSSDGTNTIGTSVQGDPWALFVNNISAIYYF